MSAAGKVHVQMLAAFGVVLALVTAAGFWRLSHAYDPPVPLTANLSGRTGEAGSGFEWRLRLRFPAGSSEQAMTDELAREGFVRGGPYDGTPGRHENWGKSDGSEPGGTWSRAYRAERQVVCVQNYTVFWKSDGAGRLTDVRAIHRASCI